MLCCVGLGWLWLCFVVLCCVLLGCVPLCFVAIRCIGSYRVASSCVVSWSFSGTCCSCRHNCLRYIITWLSCCIFIVPLLVIVNFADIIACLLLSQHCWHWHCWHLQSSSLTSLSVCCCFFFFVVVVTSIVAAATDVVVAVVVVAADADIIAVTFCYRCRVIFTFVSDRF